MCWFKEIIWWLFLIGKRCVWSVLYWILLWWLWDMDGIMDYWCLNVGMCFEMVISFYVYLFLLKRFCCYFFMNMWFWVLLFGDLVSLCLMNWIWCLSGGMKKWLIVWILNFFLVVKNECFLGMRCSLFCLDMSLFYKLCGCFGDYFFGDCVLVRMGVEKYIIFGFL